MSDAPTTTVNGDAPAVATPALPDTSAAADAAPAAADGGRAADRDRLVVYPGCYDGTGTADYDTADTDANAAEAVSDPGGQGQAGVPAATPRERAGPIDAVVAAWFDRPDGEGGHVCATCGWRYGGPVCRRCWP